eukprot:CAMPEP_0172518994 /NCGR_PEP_ID=MMETSP1066-20121228/291146_1 /TAXON_ID=671091 /ORGANISM="Coscinodiscus wailesii, Strain CCMP2513" /LENGTH=599 /DNA_ID=CAMNT_0013301491 /DNA_START=144 /DNA_END=1943 /DNA_ORIENTATION=-
MPTKRLVETTKPPRRGRRNSAQAGEDTKETNTRNSRRVRQVLAKVNYNEHSSGSDDDNGSDGEESAEDMDIEPKISKRTTRSRKGTTDSSSDVSQISNKNLSRSKSNRNKGTGPMSNYVSKIERGSKLSKNDSTKMHSDDDYSVDGDGDNRTTDEQDESEDNSDDDFDERNSRRKRISRTNRTMRSRAGQKKQAVDDSAPRRSSRKNKFCSSMEELNEKSMADPLSTPTILRKKKKSQDTSLQESDDVCEKRQKVDDAKSRLRSNKPNDIETIDVDDDTRDPKSPKSPKSPAMSHMSKRKRVKVEVQQRRHDDEEDEDSYEEEIYSEDNDEDDEGELKIQRIIASRSETKERWMEIGRKMNTSEIENGSRWYQETANEDLDKFQEKYLVKWADVSFLHCSWEVEEDLLEQVENSKQHISNFFRKSRNGYFYDADERADGDYFDPSFTQIERILEIVEPELEQGEEEGNDDKIDGEKKADDREKTAKDKNVEEDENEDDEGKERKGSKCKLDVIVKYGIILDREDPNYEAGTGRQFLIKWGNLPHTDCSYEFERDLLLNEIDYEEHVDAFYERTNKPTKYKVLMDSKASDKEMRQLYKIL